MAKSAKDKIVASLLVGNAVRKANDALPTLLPKLLRKTEKKIPEIWSNVLLGIDFFLGKFMRSIAGVMIPIQPKKILVMNFQNTFSDNQKYIVEELLRDGKDYDIVWAVSPQMYKKPKDFPPEVRLIVRGSKTFIKELLSAKIWIDNAFNCIILPVPKKKGQYYINTWHGSLGIKRISAEDVQGFRWRYAARSVDRLTDFCISNSKFETDVYRSSNWKKRTKILEYGHPRNDIFFAGEEQHKEIISRVRDFFSLKENEQILLYAPTYRDDGSLNCYNINYDNLVDALEQRFGGKWVVLKRLHFHNRNDAFSKTAKKARVLDATLYPDMQELMVAADIGISDYSSWVYDFMLTRRRVFLFTVDLEAYTRTRGFYYPLETTPFPIAKDNKTLCENILSFDDNRYQSEVEAFLEEKGCAENGTASRQVVEKIHQLMSPVNIKK